MKKDTEKLLSDLRYIKTALDQGVIEWNGHRNSGGNPINSEPFKMVPLPGWASIVADAISTIEELSEIQRLRSENRRLKTTIRSQRASLGHARRAARALQLEREQ